MPGWSVGGFASGCDPECAPSEVRLRSHAASVAQVVVLFLACGAPSPGAEQGASCRVVRSSVRLPPVHEASGIALGRTGSLWTHNDSGEPVLFALDTTGAVRSRVRVTGARVVDWEDVATGPCPAGWCLYLADIGDNSAARREIVVYRVAEPAPGARTTERAEAFRAAYPDGARDAEAFFVTDAGDLYVLSKGDNGPVTLYRFPTPLQTDVRASLQKVAILSTRVARSGRVTGAAISMDAKWVVVRSSESLAFYPAEQLTSGVVVEPTVFDVRGLREAQGEGVALGLDGTVYLTSEGGGKGRPGTFGVLKCPLPR
jgi:hypothetical protein